MSRVLAPFVCVSVVAFAAPAAAHACESRKNQAKIDARTVHPVAEKYTLDHPGVCPTMELLKAERELSAASKITDPWDRPYQIRCSGDDVAVVSLGCDGLADTTDDIEVPDHSYQPVRQLPAGRCPSRDPRPEVTPAFARLLVHVAAGGAGLLALSVVEHVRSVEALLR